MSGPAPCPAGRWAQTQAPPRTDPIPAPHSAPRSSLPCAGSSCSLCCSAGRAQLSWCSLERGRGGTGSGSGQSPAGPGEHPSGTSPGLPRGCVPPGRDARFQQGMSGPEGLLPARGLAGLAAECEPSSRPPELPREGSHPAPSLHCLLQPARAVTGCPPLWSAPAALAAQVSSSSGPSGATELAAPGRGLWHWEQGTRAGVVPVRRQDQGRRSGLGAGQRGCWQGRGLLGLCPLPGTGTHSWYTGRDIPRF